MRRLYDGTEHEWKIIPTFFIGKYSTNIFYPNLKIKIKNKLPIFYKNVIQEWEELSDSNPLTMENVLVQSIRYNRKILVNENVITWKEGSDLFVQNFYDENGRKMEWGVFKQMNGKNDTFFFKWRQISDAIPKEWKDKIARDSAFGNTCVVSPEPHLQVISRKMFLSRLTGK